MLLLRTYTVVPSAGEDRERPPRFYSTCNFPLPGVWLRKRITFKFGFKLRRRAYALEARAPQPSWSCERRQVTSGWAPLRSIGLHSREFCPIPVRQNLCPWECKVTPAYGTCQEGNTICCISSNDAADARRGIRFPHRAGIFTGVAGSKASCASHFQPSPRTSLRCTMPRPRERGRPIRGS